MHLSWFHPTGKQASFGIILLCVLVWLCCTGCCPSGLLPGTTPPHVRPCCHSCQQPMRAHCGYSCRCA